MAVRRGVDQRERERRMLAIYTAWHTAAFARAKKLPDLERILQKMAKGPGAPVARGPLTPEQQRALAACIALGNRLMGFTTATKTKTKTQRTP